MQSAFRALADPTRREVLRLLRAGPMTSGELAEHFPTAWATVSRHLGVLRQAGLVLAERDGQQVVYELNTTVLQELVEHVLEWVGPAPAAAPAAQPAPPRARPVRPPHPRGSRG